MSQLQQIPSRCDQGLRVVHVGGGDGGGGGGRRVIH